MARNQGDPRVEPLTLGFEDDYHTNLLPQFHENVMNSATMLLDLWLTVLLVAVDHMTMLGSKNKNRNESVCS